MQRISLIEGSTRPQSPLFTLTTHQLSDNLLHVWDVVNTDRDCLIFERKFKEFSWKKFVKKISPPADLSENKSEEKYSDTGKFLKITCWESRIATKQKSFREIAQFVILIGNSKESELKKHSSVLNLILISITNCNTSSQDSKDNKSRSRKTYFMHINMINNLWNNLVSILYFKDKVP